MLKDILLVVLTIVLFVSTIVGARHAFAIATFDPQHDKYMRAQPDYTLWQRLACWGLGIALVCVIALVLVVEYL